MSRYFFHVKDGRIAVDHVGLVFDNDDEARCEAMRGASEILLDNDMNLWLGNDWVMTVANEEGYVLFNLHFSIEQPKRNASVILL